MILHEIHLQLFTLKLTWMLKVIGGNLHKKGRANFDLPFPSLLQIYPKPYEDLLMILGAKIIGITYFGILGNSAMMPSILGIMSPD
jgi:hypothetical protein